MTNTNNSFFVILRSIKVFPAILVVFLASGCDERDDIWAESREIDGPHTAGNHLVWLDRTTSRLISLNVNDESEPTSYLLKKNSRSMTVHGSRVFVTGGKGAEQLLQITDLDKDSGTPGRRVNLGGEAYDSIWISPDGNQVILTHSMTSFSGGTTARNLNKIGVINLGVPRPAINEIALQTESLAPRLVQYSRDGNLAAVVMESAIALVDPVNPRRYVRIPLRLPGGQRLLPLEVAFSNSNDYLFVRASGTSDLLVLEINDGENITASVNFLFVPGAVSLQSIVVPDIEGLENHVAALFTKSGGSITALLHASGDGALAVHAELSRQASRLTYLKDGIMLVHGASSSAGYSRWIAAWEIETGRTDEREVQGEYSYDPLVAGGEAFFRHQKVSITGYGDVPAITSVTVDPSGAWLRLRSSAIVLSGPSTSDLTNENTYFASITMPRRDSGAAPDSGGGWRQPTGALVSISDNTLNIESVVLDDTISQLGKVGNYIYALHDNKKGDLSLLAADNLSRDAARRHDGILLTGLTDVMEER